PARIGSKALGHFALIFHSELWESENLDVQIGFLLNSDAELELMLHGRLMQVRELPAVEMMATTMHIGIPESGHRGYAALGLWAEANNYHFASPSREVFIRLPQRIGDDELIAEIQIPVTQATA